MYMYTLNGNSNTLWKLNGGDKLNLIVTVPGMKVYIKPYNSKSYDKEFAIIVVNGDSMEYKTLPSVRSQQALEYVDFCSATGKIVIEANQDIELVITSTIYDTGSSSNSCKGPISVFYGKDRSIQNPHHEDSFLNGFESVFEILPAVSSFIITIVAIALISFFIFSVVSKRTREGQLDEAVPPILNNQNLRPEQFDQYIPPTIPVARKAVQPQPVYYNRPVVLMQYPGAISV